MIQPTQRRDRPSPVQTFPPQNQTWNKFDHLEKLNERTGKKEVQNGNKYFQWQQIKRKNQQTDGKEDSQLNYFTEQRKHIANNEETTSKQKKMRLGKINKKERKKIPSEL